MNVRQIMEAARNAAPELPPTQVLGRVNYIQPSDDFEFDANQEIRAAIYRELLSESRLDDLPLLRHVLEQETKCAEWVETIYDELKMCAYLLFRFGAVEDALAIWKAKDTCFDTMCGLDVQLVVGAGYDITLSYFRSIGDESAASAVEYLQACKDAGDFNWMERYREGIAAYFARDYGA